MRTYTTVQGDKWDKIAHSVLGSVSFTGALMELNPQYTGFYFLPAGLTLKLPETVEGEFSNAGLPPWKRVSG